MLSVPDRAGGIDRDFPGIVITDRHDQVVRGVEPGRFRHDVHRTTRAAGRRQDGVGPKHHLGPLDELRLENGDKAITGRDDLARKIVDRLGEAFKSAEILAIHDPVGPVPRPLLTPEK